MKSKKWLWGIFFVCAAAFVVIGQFTGFGAVSVWSLALTVLLAAVILGSILYFNFFGILVPLSLIAVLFARPLGIDSIAPWALILAAALLAIGLEIIFRKRRPHGGGHCGHRGTDGRAHAERSETFENIAGDTLHASVNLGAATKYVHADNLQNAVFSCSLGALRVYLDQVTLSGEGALCSIDCSLGEIALFIPPNWRVIDQTSVSMGNVEYHSSRQPDDSPTLTLTGSVRMGTVRIVKI